MTFKIHTYVVLLCAPQNFHTFCRHHSGRFVYLVSKQKGRKKSCYDQGFTIKDIMYAVMPEGEKHWGCQ